MKTYRVSAYIQSLEVDEQTLLVGHPFFAELCVLRAELARVFRALCAGPASAAQLQKMTDVDSEALNRTVTFLLSRHLVIPEGTNEAAEVRQLVNTFEKRLQVTDEPIIHNGTMRDYCAIQLEDLQVRAIPGPVREVCFRIVGGCLTQMAADALQRQAHAYGIEARVGTAWPAQLDQIETDPADVLIYQPAINWFLRPLWDNGPFLTDAQRGEHLQVLKEQLRISVGKARLHSRNRLLLVQGFSTPTHSPLGSTEFRATYHFHRIVAELNEVILEIIRDDPDALLIDEERLLAGAGKRRLMDDNTSLFSHHGNLGGTPGLVSGPTLEESFQIEQRNQASHLFAQAYLEAYITWSGLGRIKCIVVDLDGTLWPGVAGQGDFDLDALLTQFEFGVFAGIHQALKILRQRGVLLATCSRNNEQDAMDAFRCLERMSREHGLAHLLWRNDFAVHRINWNDKTDNIRQIAALLGVAADAILFIDDNAAERQAVQSALPDVRTLGENLYLVRSWLLSDPCLQNNVQTAESAARTQMVRAQLAAREAAGATGHDDHGFLSKLGIRLRITRARDTARVARLLELVQRTNQFNTTLTRLGAAQLEEYLRDPARSAYVLEVTDRFASYGMAGLCLLSRGEITVFALSCRVIPLHTDIPFLTAVLQANGTAPVSGRIIQGPRNQPCRDIYLRAGFEQVGESHYLLSELDKLPPLDRDIYHIELIEDPAPFAIAQGHGHREDIQP